MYPTTPEEHVRPECVVQERGMQQLPGMQRGRRMM